MDNDNKYLDRQYMAIVQDILEDSNFDKMGEIVHHGLDRKSHSIRVSYYSYKITKALHLDYEACARAGLLHDFFFVDNKKSGVITRLETLVNHPKYALENASESFLLSEKEKDIIVSHMFPVSIKIPKYAEGWIVDLVDDVVALAEIGYKTRNRLTYAMNFIFILALTYLR